MIADSVKMTLGNVLSFNDLPSSIALEVEFSSARNLGAQEIFQKLNCGKERTYAVASGYENGIDFLTKDTTNKSISDAVDKKVQEMMKNNNERAKKDANTSNTKKENFEPIVEAIKTSAKKAGLEYTGGISAVDEANAVKGWVDSYNKEDGTLDDTISWSAASIKANKRFSKITVLDKTVSFIKKAF
jgi:hypothetical protein